MRRSDLKIDKSTQGDALTYTASFAGTAPLGPISTFIPTDPKFGEQWHLLNTGASGGTPGIDINVTDVWDDYTGTGVIIGIVDDGVQHDHPDLSANYDTTLDHDSRDGDGDAAPGTSGDNHGTTVAGTIAGVEGNGIGGTGVAFDATIAGFRMGYGADGNTAQIVENLALQSNVDISNNSWGYGGFFFDDFATPEFQPAGDAILNAVTEGRDGLGTVFVFAAGNGGEIGQDANYHSFQNTPHVISVAALDHNGQVASFSTPGAPNLISAPGVGIVTTDRTGADGYSSDDYVSINGTSFAAPITSGVVALMLEANPELGYRDVQEILAYSARQTDSSSPGWDVNGAANWNGGGLHVSHDYGYGLIDAYAAVRLAETWDLTSTQANLASLSDSSSPSLVIPDHSTITDTITISSGLRIDHIEVDLDLSHTYIGDLVVSLTSPDDTTSVLVNRPGVSPFSIWGTGQDDIDFTLSSTHSWGETGAGTWTLSVTDFETGDQGILNSWTLRLSGDAINNDDTYIYTDEFGAFTGAGDAARRVLSDSDGSDTLNAAAVTGDSTIDLNPGANGTIAGNSITIASGTVIENAYAGDGNDQLTGNSVDNSVDGGRGDDVLSGGGGNDHLLGGSGDDVLSGGGGNDYFDAGSGANRFVIGAGEADDTISVGNSSLSTDILQFGGGIGLSDVGFGQSNSDLTISLSEAHGGGAVTVSGFFAAGGGQRIDTIEFVADATTLNVSNYTQLSDIQQTVENNAPTVGDQGFAVDENAASGTVVGTVAASDPDAGDVLSYAITSGNESGAFSIDAGTGEMTVAGALDFEQLNGYTLTVEVTDGGLLSDSATVSIDLTDINEAPTVGDQGFAVAENAALGSVVGAVASSDPDAGDALGYAITAGNEGGAFAIDAGSGEITVEGALDFEGLSSYALTVEVSDGGLLSDSAAVSIDLTDINEAPTVGDQGFAVDENTAVGTVVGVVAASDPDAGDALSYVIAAGNEAGAFAIDAGSGEITVAGALDFEGLSSYALTVEVSDGGLLSDSAAVSIDLTDINEAPTVGDQGFSVSENATLGTVVGMVTASDPDAGDALSYAITAGNEDAAFAIDANGVITVQGALDFETLPDYALTVEVSDGGLLSDNAVVSIDLTDINEAPTVGDQGFAVSENAAVGTVVGMVTASDPDAGDTYHGGQ